jgi:[ribosomal protein S5]-alanine N-acetyltransferase
MQLTTKRLILRELRLSDAAAIYKHINNINIAKQTASIPHPYSLTKAKQFIRQTITQRTKKPRSDYRFAITQKQSSEVIGVIWLGDIKDTHQSAEIGYWLSEAHWGKGFMTEALRAALDFLITKRNIRRVQAEVYAQNKGSAQVLKKLGFTREGKKRQAVKAAATGILHDVYVFSVLSHEWKRR